MLITTIQTLSFALTAIIIGAVASPTPAGSVAELSNGLSKRQVLQHLPQAAHSLQIKWQPSVDFATNACYHVPAIDAAGKRNDGQAKRDVTLCRQGRYLSNTNVYTRSHCQNKNGVDWCVHIYDYYFEVDTSHRHDIEHIAMVTKNGNFERASASCHGKWYSRGYNDIKWHDGGTHPKFVYTLDGTSFCFHYATAASEPPKNHAGHWFRAALVDWFQGFNDNHRNLLNNDPGWWGAANWAIRDANWWGSVTAVCPELR